MGFQNRRLFFFLLLMGQRLAAIAPDIFIYLYLVIFYEMCSENYIIFL